MFKHIMVATDFEAPSASAVEQATALARALGAQLTLLHVWEIPVYPYMDFMLNSTLITSVEDAAMGRLKLALEQVRRTVPSAESKLKTGQPWQGILDAVRELKPDLVVLGTHGRRGVIHTILGSVAEKVVRLCSAPVLTVHASKAR